MALNTPYTLADKRGKNAFKSTKTLVMWIFFSFPPNYCQKQKKQKKNTNLSSKSKATGTFIESPIVEGCQKGETHTWAG